MNNVRPQDRSVHEWYRFVLSYPPHLVQDYLDRFGMGPGDTVLDPFAGTGTTLVECKKRGIASVGIESNPMAQFASSVKLDWSVDPPVLSDYATAVAERTRPAIARDGYPDWNRHPAREVANHGEGALLAVRELFHPQLFTVLVYDHA